MKKIYFIFILLFTFHFFLSPALAQPTTPILTLNTEMHTGQINRLSTDDSGRLILTCSKDKTAKLWNAETGDLIKTFRIPIGEGDEGMLYAGAISPDGKTVVVGGWTSKDVSINNIYIFDVATNSLKHRISGLTDAIIDIEFSGEGNYMVAALGGKNGIRIFETTTWSLKKSFTDYGDRCTNAVFDNAGRLATVSWDGKIRLYSSTFEQLKVIEASAGKQPVSLAFSPNGALLAVGYYDLFKVQVFDGKTLELLYEPDVTSDSKIAYNLQAVSFSNDGLYLMGGGSYSKIVNGTWNNPIRIWTNKGKGSYTDFAGSQSTISDIKPMPDNTFIFCSTNPDFGKLKTDGSQMFYKASKTNAYAKADKTHFKINNTGSEIGVTPSGKSALTFSVNERLLNEKSYAKGSSPTDNYSSIIITDYKQKKSPIINSKAINLFQTAERGYSVDISNDAQKIVFGTAWNIYCTNNKGAKQWSAPLQDGALCVNISDNGKVVIVGLGDGTIRWHNMTDGKLLMSLFLHPDNKRWVLWTPKGYFDCSTGAENLIGWHVNQGADKEIGRAHV